MPIIRNNGTGPKSVELMGGTLKSLQPGEEATTRKFYDDPDLELVNPAPIWGPMTMPPTDINLDGDLAAQGFESDEPAFDGAMIPVDLETSDIYILKISGQVTVRRQFYDGIAEHKEKIDAYPYVGIEAHGTITKLYVEGSGTFQIAMYRKRLGDR